MRGMIVRACSVFHFALYPELKIVFTVTQQKTRSKSFDERTWNVAGKNIFTTAPILMSVWYIVSELFLEAFHAIFLNFNLYGDAMWSTNMAAGNQREHVKFTLR